MLATAVLSTTARAARTFGSAALVASLAALAAAAPSFANTPLVAPGPRDPVSGKVHFAAPAGARLNRAIFLVDGRVRTVDRKAPFRYGSKGLFDTRRMSNGRHRLTVRTHALSGTIAVTSRVITVRNSSVRHLSARSARDKTPPTVSWKAPALNANVSGILDGSSCEALASDKVGIQRVEFWIDGTRLNTEVTAPYNCVFDTRTVPEGYHDLKALAYDARGNMAQVTNRVSVQNMVTPAPLPPPPPLQDDALSRRTMAQLKVFTDWLAAHGVQGAVEEFGVPHNADAAKWNEIMSTYTTRLNALSMPWTAWASGRAFNGNPLAIYNGPSGFSDLSVVNATATALEPRYSPSGGVNDPTGASGADANVDSNPDPVSGGGVFSNLNPGTINVDYAYPSANDIAFYASRGVKIVRLGLRWERMQPTLNGALHATEVARVQAVLDAAAARGLKVLLAPFGQGGYIAGASASSAQNYLIGSATVTNAMFANFWQRMATQFGTHSALFGYSLINEPNIAPASWQVSSQAAVTAIRGVDTTHEIWVPGSYGSTPALFPTQHPTPWISDPAHKTRYIAHHYWDSRQWGAYGTYAAELATAEGQGY